MYYETNRPTLGHIVPSFYQQDIIDWLRRITCFRRKSAKISARSLRSLAIIYVFFSSFCFSGRNKSSWTKPYHECYEHKDIIYCTDKPCDLSTEYWGESYVSDPKIPQISARSQYSFFISFWFSGRLKKTYTFLTQSRKSAKISARSLCSLITINGFFSSFWNVSGRYKSSWIRPYITSVTNKRTHCTDKLCDSPTQYWEESHVSDTHTKWLARKSQSFIAFSRVSGRYVKHFSDAKVQIFWLALSARSISFFSSFLFLMNKTISWVLRTQSWTYCTDKQWLISNV